MQKLKTYFSLFFLSLFLFPMAEKQVHAFSHDKEFHCSATDKHFHEVEHICGICDYTSTDSSPFAENIFSFTITGCEFTFIPFLENVNSAIPFHHLPSRAPPVA
jgi:hypothetical protein